MHVGGYGDAYDSSYKTGTLINTSLMSGIFMMIGIFMILFGTIMNYVLIKLDKDTNIAKPTVLIGQVILIIMIIVILFVSGESDTNGVPGAWKDEGYKVHKTFLFVLFELGCAADVFLGFLIFPLENRDIVKESVSNYANGEYEFSVLDCGYKYSANEVKAIANNFDLTYVCKYEDDDFLAISIFVKPYRGISKIKEFNLQVLSASSCILFEVRKDDLLLSPQGTTFKFKCKIPSRQTKIVLLNYGYDETNCRFDIGKKQIKL